MKKIKQHFAVTNKSGNKIAYRNVIAFNSSQAWELIVDYVETNWGSMGDEEEYNAEILNEEEIETEQASNVY